MMLEVSALGDRLSRTEMEDGEREADGELYGRLLAASRIFQEVMKSSFLHYLYYNPLITIVYNPVHKI